MRYDIVIVGAGIIGLATARSLAQWVRGERVAILEKEPRVGAHQTGHNSGVLHAGLYYAPGSLKARLCRGGKAGLERYASERGLPIERVGKLVVATTSDELPRLEALFARARENGVPDVELVGPVRIHELEPAAAGVAAIWSPSTAIVDFVRVASALAEDLEAEGVVIRLGDALRAIEQRADEIVLETQTGEIHARHVIVAAGLWADKVARMTGDDAEPRIVPFRGHYYALRPESAKLVRGLIYPVPDPRFPFLGVHLTRRIDGAVWAGPNAVLAFAREGYRRRDIDLREVASVVAFPGFLRLARTYWRTGLAEMWRDLSEGAFLRSLQRYIPTLTRQDLVPGPSGVRAQALERTGRLVDDFRFGGSGRIIHVRNAPSPGATASLAIGNEIALLARQRFGLA